MFAGKYTIKVGNKYEKIDVKIKNDFSNPTTIKIKKVKWVIDLNSWPQWKVRDVIGLNSKELEGVTLNTTKISSTKNLSKFAALSKQKESELSKYISKIIPTKRVSPSQNLA